MSLVKAAKQLSISRRTTYKWLAHYKEGDGERPLRTGTRSLSTTPDD